MYVDNVPVGRSVVNLEIYTMDTGKRSKGI